MKIQRRTLVLPLAAAVVLCALSRASAQTPTPTVRPAPTPERLAVVFENDDARDGLYESATDAIAQAHFARGVPLSQMTVPCGPGSTLSPYKCVTTTYHQRYAGWITQNPGLFEVGQHGITHAEQLGTMAAATQLDLITRGLQEMQGWNLPGGGPVTFAPPFASANADTIAVLEQLGFETSIRDSDTCLSSSSMTSFCESISLCARDSTGGRVAGPSCVLLPASTLIRQVNERQYDGKVFIVYHSQDFLLADLRTVDPSKMTAFGQILQAFKNEEAAGHYRLMTFRGYHDAPPLPTPTPGADRILYDDYLNVPWSNISWSATVDGNNASPVLSGTRSLKVVETGWGALSVLNGTWTNILSLDPTRYQSLDFAVYTTSTGFTLGVQLENEDGDPFPANIVGTIAPNQWTSVSLSMSALAPSHRPFDRVDLFDANGANRTYYVDDLRLSGGGSTSATPAPTGTPRPTSTPAPPTSTPAPPTPTATRTATPAPPTPTATRTATPAPPTPTPTRTPTPPPGPTPTPTPPGSASIVYADALAAPWVNVSWSSTVTFANTSPVFAGTRSVRVDETGWGAFSVHSGTWSQTQHRDPSLYASLQFRVYAPTAGFNVAVQLENDAKASFPEVPTGVIPANQWVLVSVPMPQLDPSGVPFDRVDIRDFTGTTRTYYLDEIQLVAR